MAYLLPAELRVSTLLSSLDDPTLIALEERARKYIDSYCRQAFIREDGIIVEANWDGGDDIWVGKRIRKITGVNVVTATNELVPLVFGVPDVFFKGKYSLHLQRGYQLKRWAEFSLPIKVLIEGDFGWEEVPNEVKEATLIVTESIYLVDKNREAESSFFSSVRIGDFSYSLDEVSEVDVIFTKRVKDLLKEYRAVRRLVVI